ncbi:Ig-like domain-containing protein [Nocardioides zeicaulis]|uniref:Ig-like domain-containing protein n=1 Tax=Nocardioides zeicaulis TaxID=1776857 RepID=A0ABV6DZ03_9ACTN
MLLRHRLAATTALTLAAGLPVALVTPAHAGAVGSGETVVSGTTTAGGVGESVATALPDGRTLVAWEGTRAVTTGTAQGLKREIWGRVLDASGAALGSPALLAQMGAPADATQDAADPSLATLPDGRVVLVFAGDVLADTAGAPTPIDTTSWQVQAVVLDPAVLGQATPVALTGVAPTSAAYDQQHPDVALDHGQLRVVWDGDTPATGDGAPAVWTTLVPTDLSGTPTVVQVSPDGQTGTRPRVAALTTGASTRSAVVWEGVAASDAGGAVRRIGVARLTGTTVTAGPSIGAAAAGSAIEQLAPDVVGGTRWRAVWSSNLDGSGTGAYRIWTASFDDAQVYDAGTAVTSGAHDTWPSVTRDTAQDQDVVSFARRTATAGTGHYEVVAGRVAGGTLVDLSQVSTTDADMSYDNAESMRPATVAHPSGAIVHAWSRVRADGVPGVAVRRSAALVDLTTSVTVTPARPAPARTGVNPADTVTVTVGYGSRSTSVGSAASALTFSFPGFDVAGTSVSGPAVAAGPGRWDVPAMAPGASGTITLTGTMATASEGTVRTATTTIAATSLVVDDPATNSTATASATVDHPPAVTGVTRLDGDPTSAAQVRWTVSLDQPVTGLDLSDLQLVTTGSASATLSGISCAGTSCTVAAQFGSGAGTVALSVRGAATATDATGKALATGNLPFAGEAYTVDRQPPTVTTTALGPDPANGTPLEFRLDFSEPVTQPQAPGLAVTGGTVAGVVRTSGGSGLVSSWTVRVTPSGDGTVGVTPGAGTSSDAAGNASLAGTGATRTSDRTAPVLTVTGPVTPQRGAFDVTVSASEPVTGLGLDDVAVTGGSATSLAGSGPWTVRVAPDTEGPVVVRLAAGAVTDAAGNPNAQASGTTTYDATRPGVTVSSAAGDPTGDDPIVFTLTFTEPVTGLDVGELTVTGGAATMTGAGATRRVEVVPAADGPVSVAVPADVAVDAAGNGNTAGDSVTRTHDTTGPTPQLTTTAVSPSNASSFPVTVTWPERVLGFGIDDVLVTRGTAAGLTATGPTTWTMTLTPAGDGPVRLGIAAGAAVDEAGNASLAATQLTVTSDRTAPTTLLSTDAHDPTRRSSFTLSVAFGESVTGLSLDDFVTANAGLAALTDVDGDGADWTLTVSPLAEGPVSVRLPAGAATDLAGNASAAGAEVALTYDATATADLAYAGPSLVNAPVAVELTLSDPATIVAGDLDVTNATVTSLSGGPRVYDLVLSPTADGEAAVQLPAGAFTDAAGNTSTASQRVSVVYDATAPTVTRLDVPARAGAPYPVAVRFSEPVTSLGAAGIDVTNGTAAQVTGSGRDWTFVVTPAADGQVTVTLAAGAARDAAGNPSAATGAASTTYDTTAPTVTVGSPTAAVVTTSPVPVEIVFSETVTGLDVDDVAVTNGVITSLAGGGTRWTADLVPAGEGEVTVRVRAGATTDEQGLPSAASNTLVRDYDSTRPTLALTSPLSGTTRESSVPVTATFSKPVLGFDATDLRPVGASVGDLTRVDARTWTFELRPLADGDVEVSVPDAAAASAGGNLALGGRFAITVDRAAPVLRVSGPATTVEDGPVVYDVVASEPVTGLDEADLSVAGSAEPTTVALVAGAPGTWQVTVGGMVAEGDVTLAVRAGAVVDAAGNGSAAAAASTSWRPAGRLRSVALVQQAGSRQGNRVSLPVAVRGRDVRVSATSSNPRLLPASAISLTQVAGGETAMLTLAARPHRSGTSRVVVTVSGGGTTRVLRLRMVVGGRGDEQLRGSRGTDVILARIGSDTMLGRGGDDHLYGGYGADRLVGGRGDDLLIGGPGRDRLTGGSGADLFVTWGLDELVDVTGAQGDRTEVVDRAGRRLLGP